VQQKQIGEKEMNGMASSTNRGLGKDNGDLRLAVRKTSIVDHYPRFTGRRDSEF
jgi:hypothetical protein